MKTISFLPFLFLILIFLVSVDVCQSQIQNSGNCPNQFVINIQLQKSTDSDIVDTLNPPSNLYVNPLTLIATWDPPDTALSTLNRNFVDYQILLDSAVIGTTTDESWNYTPLIYGQEYVAGVQAHYTGGMSVPVYDTFISEYLIPVFEVYNCAIPFDKCICWDTPADTNYDPPIVPEGLIGYNIYKNGEFLISLSLGLNQYCPYIPEPGIYYFTLTALYDLTSYGFPGEIGESMEEGPVIIVNDDSYELDFTETWSSGSFVTNNWSISDPNWSINFQVGNPAPSAEFTWDPIQSNYAISLESYPLNALNMTEGKIFLDYDLKLNSYNPTGDELMNIQVWNWEDQEWTTVKTYSNLDGSFDWLSDHVNIKAQAMGKIFKVRFLAQGNNSLDIIGWFVDNIKVYRKCPELEGVLSVEVVNGNDIQLDWNDTTAGSGEWIFWDDGVNENAFGTGVPAEFDVAARWDAAQLVNYDGASVTQVSFFPAETAATYKVRVWIGANATNMVVDQAISNPLIGQWNTVTLNTPGPIDITQELWIGYNVNTQAGYPAGTDDGPAVDGYGNMINFGEWQTLLDINPELDYNWNIQAYIEFLKGTTIPLTSMSMEQIDNTVNYHLALSPGRSPKNTVSSDYKNSHMLIGFNIYESINGDNYELMCYWDPFDCDLYDLPNGYYCFKITGVFGSETDFCESNFSNEACALINVGIDEPDNSDNFKIYPNPATDRVIILTNKEMKKLIVYNVFGQKVTDQITTGTKYELNTASYNAGVYLIGVETEAGVSNRALTILK